MQRGARGWAGALLAFVLVGCAGPPPMASVAPVEPPIQHASVPAVDAGSRVVPQLETIDPATIPELQVTPTDAGGVNVGLPQLANAGPFSAAVREVFAAWVAAGPPGTAPAVDWSLLAAAGPIIGVGLRETVSAKATAASHSTAVFADLVTEEVWPGASLLKPDSFGPLARLVRTAVSAAGLAYPFGAFEPQLTPDDLDVVAVTPTGALQVRVDQYVLGPRTSGEPVVEIIPAVATDLLSEIGLRVRDAVMSGKPLVVPEPPAPPPPPDCSVLNCVALTFDDGPGDYSLELISILASLDAPATVFLQGNKTAMHPELAQAYATAGVQLCGHAYSHRDLTAMSPGEAASEFVATLDQIASATGIRPNCQRPPYGAINGSVASVSPTPLYMWAIDPRDWQYKDATITHDTILSEAAPGAIILLHETQHSTLEALPAIVADLRAAGYTLVTLDVLMTGRDPQPGQLIMRR